MQSWFEVWKGVKTIQNFAAIEINRKFTKLNFTNSRMSLVWIKFSFSSQFGIFKLLIFLIANQWREPMTNGANQKPIEETNDRGKYLKRCNVSDSKPRSYLFPFLSLHQMCKTHPGVQQEEVAAFFLGNSTGGNNGKAGNLLQKIIAKPLLALCACHPIVQLHYSVTKSPQQ